MADVDAGNFLMLMPETSSTASLKEKATLYAKESLSYVRVGGLDEHDDDC